MINTDWPMTKYTMYPKPNDVSICQIRKYYHKFMNKFLIFEKEKLLPLNACMFVFRTSTDGRIFCEFQKLKADSISTVLNNVYSISNQFEGRFFGDVGIDNNGSVIIHRFEINKLDSPVNRT